MDKIEFKELQKEIGKYLYEYEKFIKDGHIIDMKYIDCFYDLLVEQFIISSENMLLHGVCDKLNNNIPLTDVDSFIVSSKKDYNQKIVTYNNKRNNAKYVIDSYNDEEASKELEEVFRTYCLDNHPAVKIMITKLERMTFDELRVNYLNNNLSSYTALYELQKESIRPCMLTDEHYEKAISYYNKVKQDIMNEMEKKISEYPYIKKEVFDNDITIAREKADLIVNLNKQKQMNKALHQDVINIYGEDIKIN
jgi:hypothetical protein